MQFQSRSVCRESPLRSSVSPVILRTSGRQSTWRTKSAGSEVYRGISLETVKEYLPSDSHSIYLSDVFNNSGGLFLDSAEFFRVISQVCSVKLKE